MTVDIFTKILHTCLLLFFFALYKMLLKSSAAAARWGLFRRRGVCPFLFGQFTFLLFVTICSYTLGSVVPTYFFNLQYLLVDYTHLIFLFLRLFHSHTTYIYIYIYIYIYWRHAYDWEELSTLAQTRADFVWIVMEYSLSGAEYLAAHSSDLIW